MIAPTGLRWQRQDDLPARGQLLAIPAGRYDWVYLALDADADVEVDETVWLHYRNGIDQEYLRSLPGVPPVGRLLARVGVPRRDELRALRLPNRPDLRVPAIAFVSTANEENIMMAKLAMFGGERMIERGGLPADRIRWPVVTGAEHEAVRRVLDSGSFTSNSTGRGEVALLEQEWAAFTGAPHCAAVSNGTTAIELALAAAGIEPGAEILVPALTFIASAVAPVQRMVIPVFTDIDPVTYTMSPAAAEAMITPRTRAILAVHLHGLPCDMGELTALAARHDLLLIEDAAQSHGAWYEGRRTGTLGDIATFSLNVVKNLPTCGEGGLVTTAHADLHRGVVLARQFGEELPGGRERDYISQVLAGNAKLSAIQAAFTRCQLARLADYDAARQQNVRAMFEQLAELPGLVLPAVPAGRSHAWHILRFRFDPAAMGHADVDPGALRSVLHRALRAEGVPVQPYQQLPLPFQEAFQRRAGFGGYPWALWQAPEYRIEDYPVTAAVIEASLTLQRVHLNPASGPVLLRFAAAFHKVWDNLDQLITIARTMDYRPAWSRPVTAGSR